VLIDVAATAVNRADLLQRQGVYPPPPGASQIIGLECSGTIAALGEGVSGWDVGEPVCALLAGGGYAERVAVPAAQLMPVPSGVDLVTAASLPEVAGTVWSNVVMTARLGVGEVLLVHGGAGGVGTHAIQVGKAVGAVVAVTAGSDERLARCAKLGADVLVNYREQDFVKEVQAATDGRGADVVLDNMGAAYLDRNIAVLARHGRLVIIGMQGGAKAELDMRALLGKCASVTATGLRYRPVEEKGAIIADVVEKLWPLLETGEVRPVVHEVLPIQQAAEAHRLLEEGSPFGKVVLRVR
jgi:putative PIG3 family NAD(P)H quinone oxidoreductase